MEIDGAATVCGYARAIDVSWALEYDRSGWLLAKASTEGLLSHSVVDGHHLHIRSGNPRA